MNCLLDILRNNLSNWLFVPLLCPPKNWRIQLKAGMRDVKCYFSECIRECCIPYSWMPVMRRNFFLMGIFFALVASYDKRNSVYVSTDKFEWICDFFVKKEEIFLLISSLHSIQFLFVCFNWISPLWNTFTYPGILHTHNPEKIERDNCIRHKLSCSTLSPFLDFFKLMNYKIICFSFFRLLGISLFIIFKHSNI